MAFVGDCRAGRARPLQGKGWGERSLLENGGGVKTPPYRLSENSAVMIGGT